MLNVKGNQNMFTGDRSYKRYFYLDFQNYKTEQRYREETFNRLKYSLQGFLFLSLLFLVVNYTSSTCFQFHVKCKDDGLTILTSISLFICFALLKFDYGPYIIRSVLIMNSLFCSIYFFDQYEYHTAIILTNLQIAFTGYLTLSTWKIDWLFAILTTMIIVGIDYLNLKKYLYHYHSWSVFIDLNKYNIIAITCIAFLEKGNREKWVLLDTFKKSERIMQALLDEISSPIFIVDINQRVLHANKTGIEKLKQYQMLPIKYSFSKMTINISKIFASSHSQVILDAIRKAATEKFTRIKAPLKSLIPKDDPNASSSSLMMNNSSLSRSAVEKPSFEYDNLYEIDFSKVLWKNENAYMINLRDVTLSTKTKEFIARGYIRMINQIDDYLNYIEKEHNYITQNPSQHISKPAKPVSIIISQLNDLKNLIMNSSLILDLINNNAKLNSVPFDLKGVILYIMEVLSFQAIKNKTEMTLRFEPSFPKHGQGDINLFQLVLMNTVSNLLGSLKDSKIEVNCKNKSILLDGGFMLLFQFTFPQSENLKYDVICDCIESKFDTPEIGLNRAILDQEFAFQFSLLHPIMDLMKGHVLKPELKGSNIEISFEIPFPNPVESSQNAIKSKALTTNPNFNLTLSRSSISSTHYVWKVEEVLASDHGSIITTKLLDENKTPTVDKNPSPANQEECKIGHHHGFKPAIKTEPKPSYKAFSGQKVEEKRKGLLSLASDEAKKRFNDAAQILSPFSGKKLTSIPKIPTPSDSKKSSPSNVFNQISTAYYTPKPVHRGNRSVDFNRKLLPQPEPVKEDFPWNERDGYDSLSKNSKYYEYNLKIAVAIGIQDILIEYERKNLLDKGDFLSPKVDIPQLKDLPNVSTIIPNNKLEENKIEKIPEFSPNRPFTMTKSDLASFIDIKSNDIDTKLSQDELLSKIIDALIKRFRNKRDEQNFLHFLKEYTNKLEKNIIRNNFDYTSDLTKPKSRKNSLAPSENSSHESTFSSRGGVLDPGVRIPMSPAVAMGGLQNRLKQLQEKSAFKKNLKKDQLLPFDSSTENLPRPLQERLILQKRKWKASDCIIPLVQNEDEITCGYPDTFSILVVDDSEFNIDAVEKVNAGYKRKIEKAKNGIDAYNKYLANLEQGFLYHLILMDLQMPNWDGYEATEAIREYERKKKIPPTYICALSGNGADSVKEKCMKAGMDSFYVKPMTVQNMNNLVKSRCNQIGIDEQAAMQ